MQQIAPWDIEVVHVIVYQLRAQKLKFLAHMTEQIGAPTIVVVAICSGTGAMNLISRSPTIFSSETM